MLSSTEGWNGPAEVSSLKFAVMRQLRTAGMRREGGLRAEPVEAVVRPFCLRVRTEEGGGV